MKKSLRKTIVVIIANLLLAYMWHTLLLLWQPGMGEISGILITMATSFGALNSLFFGSNFGEHWAKAKNGKVDNSQ